MQFVRVQQRDARFGLSVFDAASQPMHWPHRVTELARILQDDASDVVILGHLTVPEWFYRRQVLVLHLCCSKKVVHTGQLLLVKCFSRVRGVHLGPDRNVVELVQRLLERLGVLKVIP
jgi:hypothetical protein